MAHSEFYLLCSKLKDVLQMRIPTKISFLFVFFILIFTACNERQISPLKGSLKCYVDESLYNVVKTARDTFVARYPGSSIELVSAKAREGIAAVLNKEAKNFISTRGLNAEEMTFSEKSKLDLRYFNFCYDAVVPIVNVNDSKFQITVQEIKSLLSGQTKNYKVFVPEHNSGIYEYLKENVLDKKELQNITIVKSEEEAISKVKAARKGISFVGVNTINDVKGIRVLELGSKIRSDGEVLYYKPYAAYLITQNYPFTRTTTIFLNEIGIGLASGFATFLTSFEGQKIVAKNNLGPATVPIKMVK